VFTCTVIWLYSPGTSTPELLPVSHYMTLLLPKHRGTMCRAKCHTEQSTTPHTWWGPHLGIHGATSRYPHRVLLALVISIVINQTHYSYYLKRIRCGAKCHMEQNATPYMWWGTPLDICGGHF